MVNLTQFVKATQTLRILNLIVQSAPKISKKTGILEGIIVSLDYEGQTYALELSFPADDWASARLSSQQLPYYMTGDIVDFEFEDVKHYVENMNLISSYGYETDSGNNYAKFTLMKKFSQAEIPDVVNELRNHFD